MNETALIFKKKVDVERAPGVKVTTYLLTSPTNVSACLPAHLPHGLAPPQKKMSSFHF